MAEGGDIITFEVTKTTLVMAVALVGLLLYGSYYILAQMGPALVQDSQQEQPPQEQQQEQGEQQQEPDGSGEAQQLQGLDAFAQCLTDSGTKFFGSSTCGHCSNQKEMFGNSLEFVTYIECGRGGEEAQMCNDAGIQVVPTWVRDGTQYTGVQTFEELAAISGCEYTA